MFETHPFKPFVPPNSKYLLLGSFTGKQEEGYDWFYSNKRNQFWFILEAVYNVKLPAKKDRQALFAQLRLAITDIILSCERESNSNLDMNLKNIVYNTDAINDIIKKNNIEAIYFSSRFTEKLFKKQFKNIVRQFPEVALITLPSPSPRYAVMSKLQKVDSYRTLLPKLN